MKRQQLEKNIYLRNVERSFEHLSTPEQLRIGRYAIMVVAESLWPDQVLYHDGLDFRQIRQLGLEAQRDAIKWRFYKDPQRLPA